MGYNLFKIYFRVKKHISNDSLYDLSNILVEEGAIYDLEMGYADQNLKFHKGLSLKEDIYKVKLGYCSFNFKFIGLADIELSLSCQNNKNNSGFVIIEIPILVNFISNYKELEPVLISIVKKFLDVLETEYVHSGDDNYIRIIMENEYKSKNVEDFVYVENDWISYFPSTYKSLSHIPNTVKKIEIKNGILFINGSLKDHLRELKYEKEK